jgi:RNA polymerase sigma-70 factor (ECF subfamily)
LGDLYLACACARSDPIALAAFERAFFKEIDVVLAKMGPGGPAPDEVRQLVRQKLFVAESGARPKIADYSGQGDLRNWLRVTVTRLVLNLRTRVRPEVPFEQDALMFLLGGTEDPEIEIAKRHYRDQFREAFAEAFAALSPRERSLLRDAFGESLNVDALGALYGVHRSTAARWVVAAQRALVQRVKSSLIGRLRVGEDEYSEIFRLIESRLDVSLERYLKKTTP